MLLKLNRAWSGRKTIISACCVLFAFLLGLAGCSPAASSTAAPEFILLTATPSVTPTGVPSPTPTFEPTATLEPTATATTPPTATPVPPLAVAEDGFVAWCYPLEYAGYTPTNPDGTFDANKLVVKDDQLSIKIPASFCTLSFRFNQAAPAGATLTFYDGSSAFMRLPLQPVEGRPNEAWTTVSHAYIVNPPFWEVSYRLSVTGSDNKELWSNILKFGKPLPEECLFGGLPDPVTLSCAKTDPWEIEPWPDVTYPYDRSRLTPSAGE